ncbi:hypothetical protein [Deinococcus misasensis]|uniref:hypothetical protein n=1 Tax=Deinococcus misasensis TaxID=392413 RepID=UPI000A3E5CB3|nr:hypothetical protein [Deinococcus misasensis]
MQSLPLHCPTCHTGLTREQARCGDSVLWCSSCAVGWLPGTRQFDALLAAQNQKPEEQVYLFQNWDPANP